MSYRQSVFSHVYHQSEQEIAQQSEAGCQKGKDIWKFGVCISNHRAHTEGKLCTTMGHDRKVISALGEKSALTYNWGVHCL